MAIILSEKFEGSGFENSGWYTVTDGGTVDPDAASSSAGSPPGWGSECLRVNKTGSGGSTMAARDIGSSMSVFYLSIEFVLTSSSATYGGSGVHLLTLYSSSWNNVLELFLAKLENGKFSPFVGAYHTGSQSQYAAFSEIDLNEVHRFEFKWDATNGLWAWKLDGVAQPNNIDSTSPVTSDGTISGGPGNVRQMELGAYSWYANSSTYYDIVAVDDSNWLVSASLAQNSFRFANDDGSESSATWKGSENTNISIAPGAAFRVRILVDATGDPESKIFKLEYRHRPSGGAFSVWKQIENWNKP